MRAPAVDARELFAGLPQRYGWAGAVLSFGQDPRWRRFMVSRMPPRDLVLDIAAGTGLVGRQMLARRRARTVVELDLSRPMLREALRRDRKQGGASTAFALADAQRLPIADASVDGLTFTYLLRYVNDPDATLRELARVMRPGAPIANLEFFVPPGRLTRLAWRIYVGIGLPLAGRLLSPAWGEVGRFLGPSITAFYERYPFDAQLASWHRAGFEGVQHRVMSFGGGVVIWARRAK